METDNIAHLKALKKVKQERSKALELQIATLGISCPPEIRTEYDKIKQEIHALDQAIAQSRAPRRSPATRKRSAPPVPDTGASAYERVHERIGCPYPGMAPFRPEDTRFFYGRESEIQQMLKHLRQRRCLYVIGPSGSGKSSLIQAGLLPRLHQSQLFQPGFWLARGMRPGAQPIQRLGETIGRDLADPAQAVAGLLAAHPPAQHLLLILDQFEELFTQADREEQSRFIAIMRALQEVKECALLIAMRADFYPDLMTCDLWPIAPSQRLDIGPLRGARLRQAIERPAADVGVRLEPELLERLMADAADEPGVLPLVQETMTVLWSEMLDQQLTLSAYERMSGEGRSGLAAALAMKADATFDDLSKPRQAIASRIFLRLVQFGEGRADTRRQQPVTALHAANDQPELFETTLRYLTENRLLTLSGEEHEEPRTKNQEPIDASRFSVLGSRFSVVDIAHESLITGWKTFQRWLTERREAEQTRRRLDAKAIRWAEFGQAGGWLLDPFELREAERWLQSPDAADLGFDPALSALVQASRAAVAEAEREHAARLEAEVVKRHMAFLAEASSTLAASLDYQTTLAQIARLAVPHLADWCTVDVLEEHGLIRPVALVHIDPEREALLHEIHRQHAIDSHSGHPVALVLRGGQPELARDVSDARLLAITESGELAHKLRQVGFASYMVLPLRVGARVLGAITFVSAAPEHQYGPDDLALAEELIRRAATAIENAQLFQERGRQIEQLATFNEIGRALSAVTRQDDLIALIYRQTSRLLNTANFSIALYDERSEIITFPLCYSQGRPTQRPPISAQDGLLARVIRTRAPLLLQGQPPSSERGATVRSWLGVPMIAADAVIGVIAIEDGERDDAYSQDDQRLLSTIASWAATALENAHLLDETRQSVQELTALHDISMALANTLETAAVQRIMASKVLELLQADVCAVCLLDHQRRFVQQFAVDARGMDGSSSAIMRIVERLAGRLLASKRPLVLPDVRAIIDDATTPAPIDLHSALGILIGSPEQPVGVIWLGARQPRAWHEREISLLAILTNQCEQALERARLFQSEQARRRAADTLREVAQTLTSLLAPGDITTMILDQLRRVVPYTSAALMLRDGNLLRITATRGFADPIRSRIEQMRFNLDNDPNLALIVRTRQPLVVEDAQAAEAFISINGSEHIHGWIGAPLLLDDEVIGLLRVDSSTVGAYTHEDGQLAFALASLAAQAIRNSRLFDEVNRFAVQLEQRVVDRTAELADTNAQLSTEKERLQAVHAITLELAQSLDMEATLTKALALVSRAVGTRHGSILLRDLATERLICRALLTGDNAVQATSAPITFARGPGLAGWVMRNRAAACLPDVRKDPRWLQEDGRANGVRSVAAVPLMTKDETLGVLLLSSPRINYFSSAQLQLISTIANEIAIAIHNAELYSFITDQSLRVSELLEYQRRETGKSQAILQSVTEGVIMIDEQQQVVLFNPAAEELLHIPAPFMLQKSLTHLREYNETAEAAARAELIYAGLEAGLRTLGEGEISSHSQILELPAPAQFIVLSFADVLQPFGSPYGCVIVLSDITNEIEANRAKSDFVSSIVRELRDPLTSIKGYADLFLLGKAGHLSDEQRAFVQIIKNNANRLTELNNAIAMVGSIDSGKIREGSSIDPLNLAAIIAQQCQAMRAEIEHRSLTLQAEPARDLPAISADQGHISQIIQALLSNAIKFSYPGGTITIRARRIESSIQVDIGDNGVGIAPAQQQALFRRFYRADNPLRGEVGGVGLGLAITKALVELYGGTIWVSSEVDKGSTFSFSLPITPPGMDGEE